jgi:hypothetical protein
MVLRLVKSARQLDKTGRQIQIDLCEEIFYLAGVYQDRKFFAAGARGLARR